MERVHRVVIVTSLLAVLGLGVLPASAESPKRGGELRVGHQLNFTGFDPFVVRSTPRIVGTVYTLLWGPAFETDAQGNVTSQRFESLTPSNGHKTWTWKFRKDAKFWNGQPYTAHDYAAHLNRLLAPKKRNPFLGTLAAYERVTALDDHTLQVDLKYPWAAYEPYARGPYTTVLGATMPADHVEKMDKDLNRNPIGYGPYMFESWEKGDRLTVKRNPHYGAPETQYLDRIRFKHVPGSKELYGALRSGDIDLFLTNDGELVSEIERAGRFQVLKTVQAGTSNILINTKQPHLNDVRVRRALAHAFDRETFNEVMNAGQLPLSQDIYGPSSKWHCPETGYPKYDPDKARALLAEVGKPLKIRLQVSQNRVGVQGGQLMQSILAKSGIEVEVRRLQLGAQYLGAVFKGDYDLVFWRAPGVIDPDGILHWTLHSTSGANRHKYTSAALDKNIDTARVTLDFATRKRAYCDVMGEVASAVPWLYTTQDTVWIIADKAVKNIPPTTRGIMHLAKVWLDR